MSLKQKVQMLEQMLKDPKKDTYRRVNKGDTQYVCFVKGRYDMNPSIIAGIQFIKVTDLEIEKMHLGYFEEGLELAEVKPEPKPKRTRRTKKQIENDKND